jgi:hypothetical protein
MFNPRSLVPRKPVMALLVLTLASTVVLASRVYSGRSPEHGSSAPPPGLTVAPTAVWPASDNPSDRPLSVLRLTLGPEGFSPAEVTVARGRLLLVVYNKSGLEEVTLRLDREGGGRLHESRAKGRGSRWAEVFDPAPGRYVLGVADRPEWRCEITVEPR